MNPVTVFITMLASRDGYVASRPALAVRGVHALPGEADDWAAKVERVYRNNGDGLVLKWGLTAILINQEVQTSKLMQAMDPAAQVARIAEAVARADEAAALVHEAAERAGTAAEVTTAAAPLVEKLQGIDQKLDALDAKLKQQDAKLKAIEAKPSCCVVS